MNINHTQDTIIVNVLSIFHFNPNSTKGKKAKITAIGNPAAFPFLTPDSKCQHIYITLEMQATGLMEHAGWQKQMMIILG